MTNVEIFIKQGKCKDNHCSPMSNQAWCDLYSKRDILKLHGLCHNPKCKCQKQLTFNPRQFQLEGAGLIKKSNEKIIQRTEKMWTIFIRPGLKRANPFISAGVAAKTRNPQSPEITSNKLKLFRSDKILSLTVMYFGAGLRLRVM